MQKDYKKLGDYIREVNIRNTNLEVDTLLGVSIKKTMMPSIANTVGTNMRTYKIIKKNQFAYGPVTSRNGDKISVALLEDYDVAIVSQAYVVFKVIDESELMPEYLMMWMRRPEFDRYARFKSHGSAREVFDWEEMCEVSLPIPSIDRQREIVAEYNVVKDRIALNQRMIDNLEATAQAIYKQWFVDFEFPWDFTTNAPSPHGQPYKSSGGKMVWNEELEKEVPEGWGVKTLSHFGTVITGKTPSSKNPEDFGNDIMFVTPGDFRAANKFVISSERHLSKEGYKKLKNKVVTSGSVIVTCIGSDMGKVKLCGSNCITNQQINSIIASEKFFSIFLFYYLISIYTELRSIAVGGSTMPMISKSEFEQIPIIKPDYSLLSFFQEKLEMINTENFNLSKEILYLEDLSRLLHYRLAVLQN